MVTECGSTNNPPSWTFETLLVHINALLMAQEQRTSVQFAGQEKAVAAALAAAEKAVNAALAAQEKAVSLAEGNAEKWRASANEWRGAMDDREEKFVGVAEYRLLLQRVDKTEKSLENTAGRSQGLDSGWKLLLSLASLVAIGVSVFMALNK